MIGTYVKRNIEAFFDLCILDLSQMLTTFKPHLVLLFTIVRML
jgi:hypothetical protein